ncbi:MAG: bifunctional 4-hydroxy-2-oxoglutarate aldolase/2-dehydro-3-deoxy-phosphogluconate aldolase [Pseudomonadales bacterium]
MSKISEVLSQISILPVLVVDSPDQAVDLSRALLAGGINAVEITLRTDAALEALAAVKQSIPELLVSAGTVRTPQEVQAVMDAGVDFGVSPAATPRLYDAVAELGLPFLPGVATPSEVLAGMERGFDHFKLFPAEAVGGLNLLRSMTSPLAGMKFCPTGGLNQENFTNYLALPCVFCVGGSWMVPGDLLAAGDWNAITALAKAAVEKISV